MTTPAKIKATQEEYLRIAKEIFDDLDLMVEKTHNDAELGRKFRAFANTKKLIEFGL